MSERLPLPTLLSQALVAFTIEFDNEFERLMPHRTTRHGAGQGPWLVSMVMWSNCMRFVGEDGVTVRGLERLARTITNWRGMERWGYIVVKPDPADSRPKPPRSDWFVHATPKGRLAREVWGPLFDTIEKRWRARFSDQSIDHLRDSLTAVDSRIDIELPDCLPILGYGLFSKGPDHKGRAPGGSADVSLPALLARVLLAFAIECERESELSLAICANILRVLDERGVQVRDVPLLAGVSKEAVNVAVGYLQKRWVVEVNANPKVVGLTSKGVQARKAYCQLLILIEERWQARFGESTFLNLREALQALAGKLFQGLEPYPDGWRASVPKPNTLPHFPMVLHRGGFPDGS